MHIENDIVFEKIEFVGPCQTKRQKELLFIWISIEVTEFSINLEHP
jgi:hypothetical protein